MHLEIKKRYIAFVAIAILLAVVAYFAFATQTPAKTSQDASVKTPEVQPAENPAVNAATGAVAIPADALVMLYGQPSSRYPINGYPKNIYLKNADILIKDISITPTVITGTGVNTKTGEPGGVTFGIHFLKKGNEIGAVGIWANINGLKADRKPETLGADEVYFDFIS